MGSVFSAFWQGLVAGAGAKPGAAVPKPAFAGFFASVADVLFALGYTLAAIVVRGKSPQ